MMKLGLDEENVGEFIGNDENINQTSEQIDILLNDLSKFNSEINNMFASSGGYDNNNDNNYISGKYSGINNNFTRGNNNNIINANLIEPKY